MLHRPTGAEGSGRSCGRRPSVATLAAAALILALAGCGGGGERRSDRGDAAVVLPDDPAAALAEVDRALAENPRDVAMRHRRAELLAGAGRHEEAAGDWEAVLDARPKGSVRAKALVGCARAWEMSCGELRVIGADEAQTKARAERALAAWRKCAEVDERDARLGEIRALYRLGRFAEGDDRLAKVASKSAELSQERCLALLLDEQAGTPALVVVRGLDHFARAPEVEVRELAVVQLIRFADATNESEVAHTAEGLLVRLCREAGASCPALSFWQESRQQGSENRLAAAHRQRAIAQARDALDRGRPLQAWRPLELLLRGESEGTPEVRELVNRCCTLLCSLCQEKLAIGDVDAAGEATAVIRSLPNAWLDTAERECASAALRAHQVAAIRVQAQSTLAEARKAVDERRPEDALRTLDPLLGSLPPELVPEVQMIRARALSQKGEPQEALELLERYGPFTEPVIQRLHGILLAAADRGEEAEAILESLPLKFFNVEAFDGLLSALENQEKWEKLIARLSTLGGELPQRYKPIRQRAVVGAAQRRLDNLDPQGAVDMLRGNLPDDEILSGPSGPLLVRALLESGQTERALEILINEGGGIDSVPANLVTMVANKAAHRLEPEQRFQLLRRVPEWERDEKTKSFLAESWPQYGSYLPRPGRYSNTYKVKSFDAEGQVLEDKVESVQLVWKQSYFAVHGDSRTKETWRLDGDLWIRTTDQYEWWLPVRVEGKPPLPAVESPDGVSAQIIESGHSVTVGGQTYRGCVGIQVTLPKQASGESIRVDVAPELGEVRWQRTVGRVMVEERVLIGSLRAEDDK
jgi:tetratricopeptide (TPR) repeat protein